MSELGSLWFAWLLELQPLHLNFRHQKEKWREGGFIGSLSQWPLLASHLNVKETGNFKAFFLARYFFVSNNVGKRGGGWILGRKLAISFSVHNQRFHSVGWHKSILNVCVNRTYVLFDQTSLSLYAFITYFCFLSLDYLSIKLFALLKVRGHFLFAHWLAEHLIHKVPKKVFIELNCLMNRDWIGCWVVEIFTQILYETFAYTFNSLVWGKNY